MSDQTAAKNDLLSEFGADQRSCFSSGKLNHHVDIALSVMSVLASVVATVLASASIMKPALVASIAAIPAASATLQQVVDFRGRSLCFFEHAANLKALWREPARCSNARPGTIRPTTE